MAGGDLSQWRRQNSDVVQVLITMLDGSVMRGTILQPRDKSLRELLNLDDPFIDIDCALHGDTVVAKSSIRTMRRHVLPNADQLDKKLTSLDKADPYRILGLGRSATREDIHAAYVALARTYHPDRFAAANLPAEVADYLESMARRVNGAYAELAGSQRQADVTAASAAAARDKSAA